MGGENLLVGDDKLGGRHRFRHCARVLDRKDVSAACVRGQSRVEFGTDDFGYGTTEEV